MKNQIKFLMAIFAATALISCSRVPPNHEGVLMENYGRNGMDDFSLVTGRQSTVAPGTELYTVPMFEQRGDCKTLTVFTKDASQFTIDPLYVYQPTRGKGIEIIFNYKHLNKSEETFFENIEENILNSRVLNAYREVARDYTTDSLMGNVADFENRVNVRLKTEFATSYFDLKEITSNLTPPASMIKTIEARNNAIQQAIQVENELRVAEARAKKLMVEAQAESDANRLRQQTLTSLLVQQLFIEKWDGKTPLYGVSPVTFKNVN